MSRMQIEYRKMTLAEVSQVFALEVITFSEPWSEADLRKAAEDSLYYYAVAMDGEKLCGYAGMIFGGEEGQITNVAVAEYARRQGIGMGLMEHLEEQAKARDCSGLVLEVRESNARAISLYEKCGFSNLGLRPRFYRNPEEGAYIMEKLLTE